MKVFFIIASLALVSCNKQISVVESCAVIKNAVFYDGEFKFSKEELAAISRKNKEKLVVLKKYYKENC